MCAYQEQGNVARERLGEAVARGNSSVLLDHTIMYTVGPVYKGHSE